MRQCVLVFLGLYVLLQSVVAGVAAESCVSGQCHQAIGALVKKHQPVKDGECLSCHKQLVQDHPRAGGKSFELLAKGAALCAQCHEAMGKKKFVHSPVKEEDCLACHNPHGSKERALLAVGDDQRELCLGCHDPAPFKLEKGHKPVSSGLCTACHNPHESDEPKLMNKKERDVCSSCHSKSITTAADTPVIHAPVKDEPCSVCHLPHGSAVPRLLKKKVPELCADCHEPMGKKKVVHPPVADGDCLACHRPHIAKGTALLNIGDNQGELCFGCHDSAPFNQKHVHGPVAVGSCTECHSPHEAQEKKLIKDTVRNLCLKCHRDFAKAMASARKIHPPVQDEPCTVCHTPHSSPLPKILKQKVPDLCTDCHNDVGKKYKGAKTQHMVMYMEGSCSNCHSSHYSNNKALLPLDEKTVCLGCHGDDKAVKSMSVRNIRKDLEGKKYLHGPLQKNECSGCHDPHGSDYFRMFPAEYPATLYAPYRPGLYNFCLTCHDKNLLQFPDTTIYTKFRNGKQNLHYLHVADPRKGRTCRVCHEPHGSNGIKLISSEGVSFGEWKIPIRFVQTETGGSCSPGCHRMVRYDRDNPQNYQQDVK